MKRKIIYSLGFLLSVAMIVATIFTYSSNQKLNQQAVLKETIEEHHGDLLEEVEEESIEVAVEENHQEETIDAPEEETPPLPERISEVLENTLNFFSAKPIQIVAIGDSLTQGIGDSTEQGGYVGILDRTINVEKEVAKFENYGKRGNRSIQLLERLDEKEIKSSIKKADMILITIGANDIMQVAKENIMNLKLDDFLEQREQYEQNLERILMKIRKYNKDSDVYLIGFYNPFERYFSDIKELDLIVQTYNETTRTIATQYDNVTYIPTMDLFSDSDANLFAEDNFHPNYLGYFRMAKRVLDYITNEES